MRSLSLAVALLSAIAPHSGLAQAPPPLVERIDVNLVNVDVTVTDDEGNPVTGLGPEDFEVFEDGVRQEISGFYVIERQRAMARSLRTGKLDETEQSRFHRKVVLLIDNTTMDKVTRDRAIDEVNRYLEEEFEEQHEWAVVSIGSSLRTLQGFTGKREEIRAALLRVREQPTFEVQRELDRRLLSDPIRTQLQEQEFAPLYDFGETVRFKGREQTMRNILATREIAKAAVETCRAFSSSAGKKLLILVSGGMELNTNFAAHEKRDDTEQRELRRDLERIIDLMVREANAANFNIYVVNARGMDPIAPQHDVVNRSSGTRGFGRSAFDDTGFSAPSDISDRTSASLSLALGTGGRYLSGRDVRASLDTIDSDASNFYSLAYRPAKPEDGKYHQIEVHPKNKGLRVQHRQGYLAVGTDALLERTLRAPLRFPKEKGSLPVTLELGVRRKGEPSVPLTASLPIRNVTFLPQGPNQVARVYVYLAIYDEHGENVGFKKYHQDLRVPSELLAQAREKTFRYTLKVPLEKGAWSVVVTLRDEISNEIGTGFEDVRI